MISNISDPLEDRGLKLHHITVKHRGKRAIHDVSLSMQRGEIVGIIGADGAGKSSLLHAVAGVIGFEGEIFFDDYRYCSPQDAQKLKNEIGFMPQGIGLVLYDLLTVDEHLRFFAKIRRIRQDGAFQAYKKRLLKMSGLEPFQDRKAENLSGGMMQKLSLICTLLHRPKLLILDEPTTGVDPVSRIELWEILRTIRQEEGTIALVSTAYMQEASQMDRVVLVDDGRVIAQGDASELIASVAPYTYVATSESLPKTLATRDRTYSLEPLSLAHEKATLEALFFVNALRQNHILSKMIVQERPRQSSQDSLLKAQGLTKKFGSFLANTDVDIELKQGEILGLLGANGAGKTTLIKMLLGLIPMDEGSMTLLGQRILTPQDRQQLKASIGYVSQHFALYNDMTIHENLRYFGQMQGLTATILEERIAKYAKNLGFDGYLNDFPSQVPMGINQRFSLTAALLHEPLILFLDEPTSGVDAIARAQFWDILMTIKEAWGLAVLITTHYMSEAEFCDRIILMREGTKIADATLDALYQWHPHATNFEEIFMDYYR